MERLQKEALKLEKMRAKKQVELMELDRDEEAQEKQLQAEARRRYELDRQRKLYQEQEDRMLDMIDAQMDRQQQVAQRLKAEKERKQQEIKEKQQKYQAKIDAIAEARKKTTEEELKKAEAIESRMRMASPRNMTSPRRGVTPRGTSPRRGKDLGASTDSISSHARHEIMANRRLEEEKQALMKRIEREKEKLDRIAREKELRKVKAAQLRKAARPDTRPGTGEEVSRESMADEDAAGTGVEPSKQKLGARRAAQAPRLTPRRAAPKPEPLTQEEAERLGFIKKQRCAVCTREYTLENLPSVVSYRAVEVLRENWSAQFGTTAVKDARYAAATKLYDQVRVCVFCFQHFDPDQAGPRPAKQSGAPPRHDGRR